MLQTKQNQCQDQEKPTKRCQYLHVALRLLCNSIAKLRRISDVIKTRIRQQRTFYLTVPGKPFTGLLNFYLKNYLFQIKCNKLQNN